MFNTEQQSDTDEEEDEREARDINDVFSGESPVFKDTETYVQWTQDREKSLEDALRDNPRMRSTAVKFAFFLSNIGPERVKQLSRVELVAEFEKYLTNQGIPQHYHLAEAGKIIYKGIPS